MRTEQFTYKDETLNEIGYVSLNIPTQETDGGLEILCVIRLCIDGEVPNRLKPLIRVFELNLGGSPILDSFENIMKKYYKENS